MPELQKRSVIVMLILIIFTNGIYSAYWLFKIRKVLNELNSEQKISKAMPIAILIILIVSTLFFFMYLPFAETEVGIAITGIDNLISITGGIMIIVLAFQMKKILEDHYKWPMSGAGTFFFTILYVQARINRIITEGAPTPEPTGISGAKAEIDTKPAGYTQISPGIQNQPVNPTQDALNQEIAKNKQNSP